MRAPRGKEWAILAAIFCALASAAFHALVHAPLQRELEEAKRQEQQLADGIVAVENFVNSHPDMKSFVAELGQRQERAARALPDTMEQGSFVNTLQRLALGQGIELLAVVPGQAKELQGMSGLPVRVEMKCTYFQLLDFLGAVQDEERFVQIRRLEVHPADGRLDCKLETEIYAAGKMQVP